MPHAFLITGLLGSTFGLLFAAVSTYDFVAHLDRQVHGLHCSFLPGVSAPDASGASGCHATMMSPYSSLLRERIWGGLPISLPAMAVFAFLLFWGFYLWLGERTRDARATGFYALASCLPVLASLVMATVAARELGAFCKLCVGMYAASALTAIGAFGSHRRAEAGPRYSAYGEEREPLSWGALFLAFALGCLFVGSSTLAYALHAPNFERYVGSCGQLPNRGDPQHALLLLATTEPAAKPTVPAGAARPELLEVLDPLCPACRAFERRFERLDLSRTAERRVLLFPLDNSCNWMVDRAIHPGACAISEALLCADQRAGEVLAWAFSQQEELIAAERAAKGGAGRQVNAKFPWLAGCVGTAKARARLNRALRWAVDNQLPVLTPQLYVGGTRLCDADTDLGLDYMLTRLASRPQPRPAPATAVPGLVAAPHTATPPATDEQPRRPAPTLPSAQREVEAQATGTPPPSAQPPPSPAPGAPTAQGQVEMEMEMEMEMEAQATGTPPPSAQPPPSPAPGAPSPGPDEGNTVETPSPPPADEQAGAASPNGVSAPGTGGP